MKNFLKAILKYIAIIVVFSLAAIGATFLIVVVKDYFEISYKMFAIYSGSGILMLLGVIKFFELIIKGFKFLVSSVIPSAFESRATSILNKNSDK